MTNLNNYLNEDVVPTDSLSYIDPQNSNRLFISGHDYNLILTRKKGNNFPEAPENLVKFRDGLIIDLDNSDNLHRGLLYALHNLEERMKKEKFRK